MRRAVYINRNDSHGDMPKRGRRRFFGITLVVLIIIGLLIGAAAIYLNREETKAAVANATFRDHIDRQEYSQALNLYRLARRKAAQHSFFNPAQSRYAAAIIPMETLIFERTDRILLRLKADPARVFPPDEKDFLQQMSELSGQRIEVFIEELVREVMNAQMPVALLKQILSGLADLPSVRNTILNIERELPVIEEFADRYAEAMHLVKNADWLSAWKTLHELREEKMPELNPAGLPLKIINTTLTDVKKNLSSSMKQRAQELLDRQKYYSALLLAKEMLTIYPGDSDFLKVEETALRHTGASLIPYSGEIEHITFKPLIIRPDLAFTGPYARSADSTMLTVNEFKRTLEELYDANYVLVSQRSFLDSSGRWRGLNLPEGKRPLIMTIEGLNYYATRYASGNCLNLVLDDNGRVAGLYQATDGREIVDREAEAIGILEIFIEQHPDFSFDGAKANISLTARECVFGYITTERQLAERNTALANLRQPQSSITGGDLDSQRRQAKAVADVLKRNGWEFASQSYDWNDIRSFTLDDLKKDTVAWKQAVEPITGPVDIFCYPRGGIYRGTDERKKYLQNEGFRYFNGQSNKAYMTSSRNYLYMDRIFMGGSSLRNGSFNRFFDWKKIINTPRD